MRHSQFISIMFYLGILVTLFCENTLMAEQVRPNILWITAEDIGPHWGCYGDSFATTPHLDEYAKKSMLYTRAWSNAPVCAPARTTIITGMYPSSTGSEHMRSMVELPKNMSLFPVYLRKSGYYCTNNSKEDYNVSKAEQIWDESSKTAHWKNRKEGQPFFAVFNFMMTHESQIRTRPHTWVHDPAKVPVPPYHPDTNEVRQDWSQYYDNITEFDLAVQKKLKELENAGLSEDTIVFVYGDHGSGMPRNKRWPYNSGLQVPILVHMPEKFKHLATEDYAPGGKSDRLISFVDLAPTMLKLAGVNPPAHFQGKAFLGEKAIPRQQYIHGFRGRMDERADVVRSVRNNRYVYVRQYHPQRIYGQHISYMFETPTAHVWKKLFDEGKLTPEQAKFWQIKPAEELFDLENDPHEIKNLVDSPEHQNVLKELRQAHQSHMLQVRDLALMTEGEMHRRCMKLNITPYELGHSSYYNLADILVAAEVCAGRNEAFEKQFSSMSTNQDSAMRYWSVVGLQVRGKEAVNRHEADLVKLMQDKNPSVSIYSAEALIKFTENKELKLKAEQHLASLVGNPQSSVFDIMMSLQVLDESSTDPKTIAELVRKNPITNKTLHAKYVEYPNRLLKKIEADAK